MPGKSEQLASASAVSRRSFLTVAGATAASLGLTALSTARAQDTPARPTSQPTAGTMTLGMVLFDGFQTLDAFGPLEMFGDLRGKVNCIIIAEKMGTVKSSSGQDVMVNYTFATAPRLDIVMIPGGAGTRREVNNAPFVASYKKLAEDTPHVASICTGAAVLAKTGLLDGLKATTNKHAFAWATSQGPNVKWVKQARWVEDGKYFTSSGISAGTDMALALIEKLFGRDMADQTAITTEYKWDSDPTHDPFAKINGLVG